jgi:phosphopantetheinyl transferase
LPRPGEVLPFAVALDRFTARPALFADAENPADSQPMERSIRREENTARRSLLRLATAAALGLLPGELHIEHGAGAPRLQWPTDVHLSATSRGRWIAVAIARNPIGIDVESITTPNDIPTAAYTAREAAFLSSCSFAKRLRMATAIFSAKEATIKRLGLGMEFARLDIRLPFRDPRTPVSVVVGGDDGYESQVRLYPLSGEPAILSISV